jgi:hypothetical protein
LGSPDAAADAIFSWYRDLRPATAFPEAV